MNIKNELIKKRSKLEANSPQKTNAITASIHASHKHVAFTLAEVLITLGIIGVVAAITITPLIQKYQEKVWITQLKKHYSLIQQAYKMAQNEYGTLDTWDTDNNSDTKNVLYYFKNYLEIEKYCGIQVDAGCWLNVSAKGFDNKMALISPDRHAWMSKAILKDGSSIAMYMVGPASFDYFVDINGKKGPNCAGKDIFNFRANKDKILPYGTLTPHLYPFDPYCKRNSPSGTIGCTAWVLQYENMDYLHCDDLSLGGKTKCK